MSTSNSSIVLFDRELTAEETEILKGVLDPSGSVELIIPEQIDPQQLWSGFETCCQVVGRLKDANNKIKPVIGRMLVVIRDYPELFHTRGYTTYEDFLARGMNEMFGICRAEAYACRDMGVFFPSLTIEEFSEVGTAKMQWLCRMAKKGSQKAAHKMLDFAKDHTVSEVKHAVLSALNESPGEVHTKTIMIDVTMETAKMWDEFLEDPAIAAYCETDVAGKKFRRLLDECGIEWRTAGEWARAGGR